MTTIAYLRTLHAIIGSALDDIGHVYQAQNLDYPPPDVPFYQNSPPSSTSAAAKAAEELTNDSTVINASNSLVAACGQLITAIHSPTFSLIEDLSAVHPSCSPPILAITHESVYSAK